jgi:hypothetical protein
MRVSLALFLIVVLPAGAGNRETFPLRDDGSIVAWTLAGPLATPGVMGHGDQCVGFHKDFLIDAGGEGAAAPVADDLVRVENQAIPWRTVFSTTQGLLDYNRIFGVSSDFSGAAYAFCSLASDAEKSAVLKVRSNDGVRVWLNGALAHDHHVGRTIDSEEDAVPVTLNAGENRLLVKVDQSGGAWGLLVRVEAPDGKPIAGVQTAVSSHSPIAKAVTGFSLKSTPLVRRTPDGERQVFIAEIASGGVDGLVCRVAKEEWANPCEAVAGDLTAGEHRIEVLTPLVAKNGPAHVELVSGNTVITEMDVDLTAPPLWTVYLVQHVHTDIGYTRPQTEILPEHLRYIDYALDYCDLTDDYPDDAKFRWTCETSWAVREFLKRRPPQQIERLRKRIAEGRIEVAGMFLNMAETATESSLAASLMPLREIEDRLGAPVTLAMQNDVNGAAWCLVDYFAPIGIRYLTMGINKTRSLLPFDHPTPFWWESPAGNRIMAFRADHYHTGNNWRLHNGDVPTLEIGLVNYVDQIQQAGYPFDTVSVQYSGYQTDNSPPAMSSSNLIRDWNEQYAWPRLRCATASEFMRVIEERHSAELPVYRQAWPDWWTDGFGSAARETSASRLTHTAMQTSETLLAMASLLGTKPSPALAERIQTVQEKLLFYDEHTYGAAESISDPLAENTMVQWGEKGSYVWEAVKEAGLLREEALGMLQAHVPRADVPTIAVFNSLNWPRSGLVEVFIDHEILPTGKRVQIVDPEDGTPIPMQALRSRSEGTYWALWVSGVPPLGYKSYRIEVFAEPQQTQPVAGTDTTALENSSYRIEFDATTGGIRYLLDKQSGKQLVDDTAEWRLGQIVHERLTGRDVLGQEGIQHQAMSNVTLEPGSSGPIWRSVQIRGELPGTDPGKGIHGEVRLYETEPRIEIHFAVRKLPVTDPEAIYVALPFDLDGAEVWYEAQGGMVRPGQDQIPRSASDWQTVQNYIAIRGQDRQIVFGSSEVPLVQFGGLNFGKWQELASIEKPHVYSWIMNNYWFTNFRATQEGEFRWSYYITSTKDTTNTQAARFGWSSRMPMVGRVQPPGDANAHASVLSTFDLGLPNIVLVDARPASHRNGIILHLRELAGEPANADTSSLHCHAKIDALHEVDVLENDLGKSLTTLSFKPFESKFILIKTKLR